ncbi:MAG: hypothetical protein MUE46_03345 [Xanthomonadales bacterium]|nr:hypothetical protein [Xanthomonadales bacterium]
MLQATLLPLAALLGLLLAVHAASLQSRELVWLSAVSTTSRLKLADPGTFLFPDPQGIDLRARWFSLRALFVDSEVERIALLRDAQSAAAVHVQARPQWPYAWLNWARVSAALYPAGKDWQVALQRALVLDDAGWAFQISLAEFMLRHEAFMDPVVRADVEKSLLRNVLPNHDLKVALGRKGLFLALCEAPNSQEAKDFCARPDVLR